MKCPKPLVIQFCCLVASLVFAFTLQGAESFETLKKAAIEGDTNAQIRLASAYFTGDGIPMDEKEGVKWYLKAADSGFEVAYCNLGYAYANGAGVAVDKVESVKWYRKAAIGGSQVGQYNLGLAYATGKGVTKQGLRI